MNLLLVAYFYPPCRDTGAHRPAAMVKWLRRLGHRVTVLTTSAYGTRDAATERGVIRSATGGRAAADTATVVPNTPAADVTAVDAVTTPITASHFPIRLISSPRSSSCRPGTRARRCFVRRGTPARGRR